MNDSELKINHIYWAEITDTALSELCGKEIQVKFTGILFRNVKYLKPAAVENTDPIYLRIKISKNEPVGSSFYLYQIKIFREVTAKELQ
jgi:hypothetical protein